MGMVFQNFELFPHLNVTRNITIGPTTVLRLDRDSAKARADRLLAKVGLTEKAQVHPAAAVGRSAAAGGHRPRSGDGAGLDAVR